MAYPYPLLLVSFDFGNARRLSDLIIGQVRLRAPPFEVIDYSRNEAAPEKDWEETARRAIER